MAQALSSDLRRRVIDAIEGGLSTRAAALRFLFLSNDQRPIVGVFWPYIFQTNALNLDHQILSCSANHLGRQAEFVILTLAWKVIQLAQKPKQKKIKIVDWGFGPHVYANQFVSVIGDGTTVSIVLGRTEIRCIEKNGPPSEPVISICGEFTITAAAAAELVNNLSRTLDHMQTQKRGAGPVKHTVN